ncbi:MAG: phage holin family protein [Chloroflexi bacterium]|nr:phage holin family protein [Chloroflexota bacterium]
MTAFLLRLFINTVGVVVASAILSQADLFAVDDLVAAIVLALILGVLNATIRPILTLLTLPFHLLTFGLFALVVNAVILWVAALLVPPVHIGGFAGAFLAALIVAVVSAVASRIIR